ncbi:hypothetical protein EYF80_021325 [Liparis tanakae]|uniref:Uncharacterized protein n=1 Tax=Liparis tanakae TaxID=230148 RepID=A0A4Z2HTT6_9TELE|nr:hypothetical protein EYF80_021325 [Liparis tanakae]
MARWRDTPLLGRCTNHQEETEVVATATRGLPAHRHSGRGRGRGGGEPGVEEGVQSEEGSDSGAGASRLASGSAVAGEGGGEGGEGGEAGCRWPPPSSSSSSSGVLLPSPAPSTCVGGQGFLQHRVVLPPVVQAELPQSLQQMSRRVATSLLTLLLSPRTGLRSSHTRSRERTNSHSSSLDMTSQIPSHASTTNSSPSGARSNTYTSGSGLTSCSVGPLPARDTAKEPFTLWIMTEPPAFWMRSFSRGLQGLWSWVEKPTLASRHSTARESPHTHTAVEPLRSRPCRRSEKLRMYSSMFRKPERMSSFTPSTEPDPEVKSAPPDKMCSSKWPEQ